MVDRAAWRFHREREPCLPVIDEGPYGYQHVNAAKQRRDPNSMLNWTERIVRMRKEVPEIGWGDFKVIATRDPAILIIRYDWRDNSVLIIHNLDEKPREISFVVGLTGETGKLLVNLLTEDHSRADKRGRHNLLSSRRGSGRRRARSGPPGRTASSPCPASRAGRRRAARPGCRAAGRRPPGPGSRGTGSAGRDWWPSRTAPSSA